MTFWCGRASKNIKNAASTSQEKSWIFYVLSVANSLLFTVYSEGSHVDSRVRGHAENIQKMRKMMSEFIKNVVKSKVEMCMLFWMRFYWFFVDFGIFLESKWCPKSHRNLRRKTEAGTWTRKLRGTMYVISLVVRVRHYTDHVAPPESQQFDRSGTGGCTNHWKTCISGKSW